MQGSSRPDRTLLDSAALCRHLLGEGSVHAFLAEHRSAVFPDDLFEDLFPSGRGRPSVPADVIATVMVLQALEGLSDRQAVRRLETDIAWKAAAGLALTDESFHSTVLVLWRNKLRTSAAPERIFDAVRAVITKSGVIAGKTRRALDSTVLDDAVARQDTITMLITQIARVRRLVPELASVWVREHNLEGGRPPCDWEDPADKAPGDLRIDGVIPEKGPAEAIWTYVAKSPSVEETRANLKVQGAHDKGTPGGERCIGGNGSGCKGTGWEADLHKPHPVEPFRRMDGTEMHYIDMAVSVGGIVHDKSCLGGGEPAHCGPDGWNKGDWWNMEVWGCAAYDAAETNCAGVREWWKAYGNVTHSREWRYRFGPYPADASRADSFEDDIDGQVPNRHTMLPRTEEDRALDYRYWRGEMRATTLLYAPVGTTMDYTDAAFCASGVVGETHEALNTVPWAYCQLSGGGSGGGAGGGGDGTGPISVK